MVVADRPLLEVESNPAGSELFLKKVQRNCYTRHWRGFLFSFRFAGFRRARPVFLRSAEFHLRYRKFAAPAWHHQFAIFNLRFAMLAFLHGA